MPSSEVIQKALEAIRKRQSNYEYFFRQISSPDWIKPLQNAGMFQIPPQSIREGDYIQYPGWAESRYLARMASLDAHIVLEVIQQIPETDNPRIHEDFVDAALGMPTDLAVQLVPNIKKWLDSPHLLLLPEKVSDLAIYLAKGDQVEKALDLMRTLLSVQEPEAGNNDDSTETLYALPKPRIRFETWNYKQILDEKIPQLVTVAEEHALELLCSLLAEAIKIYRSSSPSQKQILDSTLYEDHSRYWRPVVEENTRNFSPYDAYELLAVAVRDAAKQLIEKDNTKLQQVIVLLEKWRWRIFHRIALYLLSKFPKVNFNVLVTELTHPKYFDESHYQDYEYTSLIQEHFASLTQIEQNKILNIIKNPSFDWSWQENVDKRLEYLRHWQLYQLTPIKDNLPKEWQEKYKLLVSEFGEVRFSDIVSGGVGELQVGFAPPKLSTELASMTFDEVVDFLKNWQPTSQDPFEPSPAGLIPEISKLITQEPEIFLPNAVKFKGLRAEYILGFLYACRDILTKPEKSEKFKFPWLQVLDLCYWALQESQSLLSGENTVISYWRSTRQEVADLFGTGFTTKINSIPFYVRKDIWRYVYSLTEDPNPNPEYEKQYGGSNMDAATLSLNTVRGKAMHTVIKYALWVRRNLEKQTDKVIEQDFDMIPEVREVLEHHLNPQTDSSVAVRAVYGLYFPQLVVLDSNWSQDNIEEIFPKSKALESLRCAAWDSYITFCSVYNNVFKVLQNEYRYAVESLEIDQDDPSADKPDSRLAQHLTTLYWRGELELEQGILATFYERASDTLRGQVFEFVGRSLKNTTDEVPPEILERLRLLWEKRLKVVQNAKEANLYNQELAAFGWWFVSRKFDDSWAMAQLQQVLQLVDSIEADYWIIEQLSELVEVKPIPVLNCLKLMVDKDKNQWWTYSKRNEVKKILQTAMRERNSQIYKVAEDLIHRLGALGQHEFRELLSA
jgi:hypothetical protein